MAVSSEAACVLCAASDFTQTTALAAYDHNNNHQTRTARDGTGKTCVDSLSKYVPPALPSHGHLHTDITMNTSTPNEDMVLGPGSTHNEDVGLGPGSTHNEDVGLGPGSTHNEDVGLGPGSTHNEDVELGPGSTHNEDVGLGPGSTHNEDMVLGPGSTHNEDVGLGPGSTHNEDVELGPGSTHNEDMVLGPGSTHNEDVGLGPGSTHNKDIGSVAIDFNMKNIVGAHPEGCSQTVLDGEVVDKLVEETVQCENCQTPGMFEPHIWKSETEQNRAEEFHANANVDEKKIQESVINMNQENEVELKTGESISEVAIIEHSLEERVNSRDTKQVEMYWLDRRKVNTEVLYGGAENNCSTAKLPGHLVYGHNLDDSRSVEGGGSHTYCDPRERTPVLLEGHLNTTNPDQCQQSPGDARSDDLQDYSQTPGKGQTTTSLTCPICHKPVGDREKSGATDYCDCHKMNGEEHEQTEYRFVMPKRFYCSQCSYDNRDAFYVWDSVPYDMALTIDVYDKQAEDMNVVASYDSAIISEAHGLVSDMLAESNLPPQVISGLTAVSNLLKPTETQACGYKPRISPLVSLTESPNYGSDTEDSPYTGERPTTLPKRLRRSLPPSLIRRMSTSTWTTTTSATGMPTVEMEPCRLRSSSFRQQRTQDNITPGSSPTASRSNSPSPSSPSTVTLSIPKARSFSVGPSSLIQPGSQKRQIRKSVCFVEQTEVPPEEPKQPSPHTGADDHPVTKASSMKEPREKESHYAPSNKRFNITSDYESSDSPNSSDHSDNMATSDELSVSPPKRSMRVEASPLLNKQDVVKKETVLAAPTIDTSHTPGAPVTRATDDVDSKLSPQQAATESLLFNPVDVENSALFDTKLLAIWDYPIFELADAMGTFILSKLGYKVFAEVGLFETFRIPLAPFLNYFHALEMGYRDIPYHNRIHAADVLHGVYYFTTQPIPGLQQVTHTDLLNRHLSSTESECDNDRQVNFKTICVDDSYGIMGGNLPALELMALYTAAAMHDYDHPGRTNAFLVTTYSPKAILYNDRSVLENHHAAAAWHLFMSDPNNNFLVGLDAAEFKRFRFIAIEAILATDLKRHFEVLTEFNAKVNDDDAPGIDWTIETDRLLVSQMIIKLSDINGPIKHRDLHCNWTTRISEEFYEQGTEESTLGMPISPFMDRRNPQLAKLQESFINHLVAPLCNAMVTGGIVPGTWVDDDLDNEGGHLSDSERGGEGTEKDTEEDTDDTEMSSHELMQHKVCKRSRQVHCVLTKNMKENHEMWVKCMKDQQKVAQDAPAKHDSVDKVIPNVKHLDGRSLSTDKSEMEPIKEESESSPKSSPSKTS